jgi:hypothetical protein
MPRLHITGNSVMSGVFDHCPRLKRPDRKDWQEGLAGGNVRRHKQKAGFEFFFE